MHHYQTLLVAIDFSQNSALALRRARQLAQLYQAELQVVHVCEVPTYPVLEDVAITGMPGIWDEQMGEKIYQAARERLTQLLANEGLSEVSSSVIAGIPRVDIVEHAQAIKADLIVMGRRGLSGIERLIGSTTDTVSHNAHCDVLAVKLNGDSA
ncbi:MAG: universal stress protein [Thiomicrospira sp.]|jgi:universal stress protein A|nr:universal stress protein [Thiomicrospira sp.]